MVVNEQPTVGAKEKAIEPLLLESNICTPGPKISDDDNSIEIQADQPGGEVDKIPANNGTEFLALEERIGKVVKDQLRQRKYSEPIDALIKRALTQEPPHHIFRGVNHPGIGAIFGPAKSGKTTVAECLLMAIAGGRPEFLGESLFIPNRRVFYISLEEYYISRSQRNQKQIEYIKSKYCLDEGFEVNYSAVTEDFPRYLITEKDLEKLEAEIEVVQPSVVVIDSLSRLTMDAIEESTVATKLMRRFRSIAFRYGITLIIIHHSHKLTDQPLTMSNMAGSRIISQELDFIIGVNRLSNGNRYLKDIAYRYHPDDSDEVLAIAINESLFVEARGYVTENDLIKGITPLALNSSDEAVLRFITEYIADDPTKVLEHGILMRNLVESKVMSKVTLHKAIDRLMEAGTLKRVGRGDYQLALTS